MRLLLLRLRNKATPHSYSLPTLLLQVYLTPFTPVCLSLFIRSQTNWCLKRCNYCFSNWASWTTNWPSTRHTATCLMTDHFRYWHWPRSTLSAIHLQHDKSQRALNPSRSSPDQVFTCSRKLMPVRVSLSFYVWLIIDLSIPKHPASTAWWPVYISWCITLPSITLSNSSVLQAPVLGWIKLTSRAPSKSFFVSLVFSGRISMIWLFLPRM